jgi:hypothetical protein
MEHDRSDPGPRSKIDRVVRATLRSPLHSLLDPAVCELSYAAPLAGHEVTFPVFYAHLGSALVVVAGNADAKRWWRAFRSPWPVDVRRHGEVSWTGIARLLQPGDRLYREAVHAYRRVHHYHIGEQDRVIVIEPLG